MGATALAELKSAASPSRPGSVSRHSADRADSRRYAPVHVPGVYCRREAPVLLRCVLSAVCACPMVMVAADPEIDPKFLTQPPKDTTFTIRSVAPTACR
jgi:hypothetical protein